MAKKSGTWILHLDTMKAEWSDELYDIFGIPQDIKIEPAYLKTIVAPEDWDKLFNSLIHTSKYGNDHNIIYRVNRPQDNEQIWVHCKAVRDTSDPEDLKLIGNISQIEDINSSLNQLEYLTRIEQVKSQLHLCMLKYKKLDSFLSQVCKNILTIKGYKGVWIRIIANDKSVFSSAGFSKESVDKFKEIHGYRNPPLCCNHTSKIVKLSESECTSCPFKDVSPTAISITTPITNVNKDIFGHISLVIDNEYIDNSQEVKFLEEIAEYLGILISTQIEKTNVIEEANNVQKALMKSMKLYSEVFNFAKVGMIMVTLDGVLTMVNDEFASMLGYEKEELIGTKILDLIYEDDLAQTYTMIEKMKDGSLKTLEAEKRYLHKDGSIIWGALSTRLLEDEEPFYIATVKNITSLKKQNEKLQRLNDKLSITQKIARVSSIDFHVKEGIKECSPHFYEIVGLDKPLLGDELYRYLYKMILPEDREGVKTSLENAISLGTDQEFSFRYKGLDQNIDYVSAKLKVDKDKSGAPVWLRITLKTITDIIKQQKLLDDQARFLEQSLAGISVTGENLKFTYVNQKYLDLWGYDSKEEVLGSSALKHCANKRDILTIATELKDKKEHTFELKAKRKDGSIFDVLMAISKIIDDDGKVYYISSSLDISKQKKAQQELHQKDQLMLMQSRQAAMGEMISMIAHQWRQPLSTVTMINNNILLDLEFEEFSKDSIKEDLIKSNEQAKHMSKTIDDFRDFFKPEKKKEFTNIVELLHRAKGMVEQSFVSKGIVLSIFTCSEEISLNLYRRELLQVILNLVNNAKDACLSSEKPIKDIRLELTKSDSNINIRVTDNGDGVPREIQERIFEPYFTTKDDTNGTGLGLYMSKNIIEKHLKGDLKYIPDDKLTIFEISLPIN